jgi:hypothetical protein
MIKNKYVKDAKLLTALYLGAFTVSRGRISTKETKEISEEICEYLEPNVARYRKEILKEFRSILLEARDGKLIELKELEDGEVKGVVIEAEVELDL